MLLEWGRQGPGGLGQPLPLSLPFGSAGSALPLRIISPLPRFMAPSQAELLLAAPPRSALQGRLAPLWDDWSTLPSWGPRHHPQETGNLLSTSPRAFNDPAVQRTCLLRSLLEGGEVREGTTPCCFWLILRPCHHPLAGRGGSTCRQSSGPRLSNWTSSHLLFCLPPANRSLALPVPLASSGHSSSSHTGVMNASVVSGQVTSG